jgi:hypothetical protein
MSELKTEIPKQEINASPGESGQTTDGGSAGSKHSDGQMSTNGASSTTTADGRGSENGYPNHQNLVPAFDDSVFDAVGGPVSVAWCESTLTRAYELGALCDWMVARESRDGDCALVIAIKRHLAAAREAALGKKLDPYKRFRIFRNGPLIERARSNLDAAEAQLLNLAPPDYILGQMPSLLRHVQRHLRPTDPGRQEFERIARSLDINDPEHPLPQNDEEQDLETIKKARGKIVTTVRAASSEALRVNVRLRSFRNVVVVTTVLLAVLAVGVAVTGFLSPTLVPLCFAPEESGKAVVVCPTGQSDPFTRSQAGLPAQEGAKVRDTDEVVADTAKRQDLMVVELVGLTAAAIAAAAAIRNIKGSSERYGLPVALAALKLPTGAITAFLGLLLMRGQFVPGLNALDTTAQILAWALVFGFAQELFTRLVDQQGQTVLNSVRAANSPEGSRNPA